MRKKTIMALTVLGTLLIPGTASAHPLESKTLRGQLRLSDRENQCLTITGKEGTPVVVMPCYGSTDGVYQNWDIILLDDSMNLAVIKPLPVPVTCLSIGRRNSVVLQDCTTEKAATTFVELTPARGGGWTVTAATGRQLAVSGPLHGAGATPMTWAKPGAAARTSWILPPAES